MASVAFTLLMLTFACGGGTDVVESGTYQGTVSKVEAEKNEIYVKTAEGKLLELYFTETTTLTKDGEPVEFSVLEKGTNVEVEIEKTGQRLDPVSVKVLK